MNDAKISEFEFYFLLEFWIINSATDEKKAEIEIQHANCEHGVNSSLFICCKLSIALCSRAQIL